MKKKDQKSHQEEQKRMISRVKQLEEALNERKSIVAESLQSLMEAEQKFEEKMKEVVKKLKEENDN